MARVEISEVVLRKTTGSNQPSIVPGASVQVNVRGSGAATVYLSSTGGTTVSNPLTADSAGRIEGWLEFGSYDLVVSGSGIATYTQRFEAVPPDDVAALAEANTFTTSQRVQGSLTLENATIETVGPEHQFEGFRGSWLMGIDIANAPKARDFVPVAQYLAYTIKDAATTNADATLTSATEGNFTSALVGAELVGSGIPAGTTVASVTNSTTLEMSANATATASNVSVLFDRDGVTDVVYVKHRGSKGATIGLGVTPPGNDYRVNISGDDGDVAMGGMLIRVGPSQTGHALVVIDSAGNSKMWLSKDFAWKTKDGDHFVIRATGDAAPKALAMAKSDGTVVYGYTYFGNDIYWKYLTSDTAILRFGTDGAMLHMSTKIGFYSATPITKPAVTGSRGGNAALASLLTQLATLGLVTDSSTA